MKRNTLARSLSRALFSAALLPAGLVLAQDASQPANPADAKKLDTVVVQGQITYRNRTEDTEPVLVYDLEFFQRFEPDTVGDMLKRVPGAAFVGSDVMEYDDVQLRGLGGGYTQVLINGKKVPGAGDDRSFFVDRIPAEMVDYIEVKRSSSANRSGDAVAGAINIVLRDSYEFDGSYIRIGANRYFDGEVNPTFGAVTSADFAGGRILAGVGMQDRYRAKYKRSDRWDTPAQEELMSWEDQHEVKDGRDYSGNLSYGLDIGESARFNVDAFYTRTNRDLTENSFETEYDYEDGVVDKTTTADVPGLGTWDQKNWGVSADYRFDMAGGRTELNLDHARFDNIETNWEGKNESEDGELVQVSDETENATSIDKESGFKIAHKRDIGAATKLEFGADYRKKDRDFVLAAYELTEELDDGEWVVDKDEGVTTYSQINEKRLDPYIQFSGQAGVLSWEAGLRYETTKVDTIYRIEEFEEGELSDADGPYTASKEYNTLLPSANLRWDVTERDRIRFSLARTVKRPNFRDITPVTFEGEFEDNDLRGNPDLEPESANGLDLGFERRLGRKGVVGVNFFYRDVKNLIELVNTGDFSDEYEGQLDDLADWLADNPGATPDEIEEFMDDEMDNPTYVYQQQNVGNGKVWGVEFDLSTPLSVFGMDNTGVFLNYAYLDSKVTDFMGERRFNNQARSTFNVGFIQNLPTLNAAFGASYRKQGDAFARIVTEEGLTKYDGDLELFVEKNFGQNISLRLTASNLLDAKKYEYYDKFKDAADQISRDYDEYEIEQEEAGPRYQMVMRWSF